MRAVPDDGRILSPCSRIPITDNLRTAASFPRYQPLGEPKTERKMLDEDIERSQGVEISCSYYLSPFPRQQGDALTKTSGTGITTPRGS